MLWHTFAVILGLRLLASVAFLSSFEVVVLAFAAFPSTVWEFELVVLFCLLNAFLWDERLDVVQVEGLVERLDTSCRSSHLSKLVHLGDGWHLSVHLDLLKRWEVEGLSHRWEVFLGGGSGVLERLVGVAFMLRADG